MKTIEAAEASSGSRDAVWALLEDPAKWTEWGSWSSVEVEGGGPQRVGAVRMLVRRPYRVRERITEWERSTVTLEDAPGGGTLIGWRSTYERAGPFTVLVLRAALRDSCKRLAKAAST